MYKKLLPDLSSVNRFEPEVVRKGVSGATDAPSGTSTGYVLGGTDHLFIDSLPISES